MNQFSYSPNAPCDRAEKEQYFRKNRKYAVCKGRPIRGDQNHSVKSNCGYRKQDGGQELDKKSFRPKTENQLNGHNDANSGYRKQQHDLGIP